MKSTTTKNVAEDSKKVVGTTKESAKAHNVARKVKQLDLKTRELIQEWESVFLASQTLDIDRSSITSCIRGARKSAGGYAWEYSDPTILQDEASATTFVKPVNQYDLNGNLIKKWNSLRHVAAGLGIDINEISKCARGKRESYKNFVFKFVNPEDVNVSTSTNSKAVLQLDEKGNLIKRFDKVNDAADAVNGASSKICDCCRGMMQTYHGYRWAYEVPEEIDPSKMRKGVPIVQLDLNDNFVARYDSLASAAYELKCDTAVIGKVLRGDRISAKGFKFVYEKDYKPKK